MSVSSGCNQQNSSCVPTNQQEGNAGFSTHCSFLEDPYSRDSYSSQIVSPLYHLTWKRNDFKWDPEQQQGFEQIKPEIVHAVALEPVRIGQDVKSVQPGRMDLPGVSHKKCLERLKDKPWGSEVGDTKDPRHATPCPEKSIWQLREGINLLQKRLAPKYGSSLAPRLPSAGLDVQRGSSFHTSCHCCYVK